MSHDSQPNTPKLRSASSPNIYSVTSTSTTTYSESASTQDKSRFDTSYIFPRDPSQIFYTPQSQSPRPASRGRASPAPGGRGRGYPTPTELNPIKILSGEAVPFFMSREYPEDEGRGREGSRLASLYADDESVAGASASGSRRQSETQSLFERGTRSSLGDGGIFSGGGAVRGNYDVELGLSHLSKSTGDLTHHVGLLTDLVQALATRVTILEFTNGTQGQEISRLRRLVEMSPRRPSSFSTTPPESHSPPIQLQTPIRTGPYAANEAAAAFYSTPQSGLPKDYFPSSSQLVSATPSPGLNLHHSNPPLYSSAPTSFDHLEMGNSPVSPLAVRQRRSRPTSEVMMGRNQTMLGFSTIAPVVAQANWMVQQQQQQQQQAPPVMPRIVGPSALPETFNYRALLEQDSDMDPEIFVRRILAQSDQQCSLYLQQRLKVATSEERRVPIFKAVGGALIELSTNKFGNFLVSRCLEYGGVELRISYTHTFLGNILALSTDQFGCHVVQKLLDFGDQTTKALVAEELIDHPTTLTHKSAGHVWNKLLVTPNAPAFYRRMSESGTGQWSDIAKNETGSLILQSVLENWKGVGLSVIASELLRDLDGIAVTQWGSFVVLQLVEHGGPSFRTAILNAAERLSLDHFGIKSVEKTLKSDSLPPNLLTFYVDTICTSKPDAARPCVVDMALQASGAQLITQLLTGSIGTSEDTQKIIRAIKKFGVVLRQSKEGLKVWLLCERTARSPRGRES